MKIEVGESLALSWLRHVRHCQVVHLNWKAPPHMELRQESELDDDLTAARSFFTENPPGYDVFKKTKGVSQLLTQAEIDALGIRFGVGTLSAVAVDIAFHEYGLNYGSGQETPGRVAKKLVRTAMAVRGLLGLEQAEITFASPKVGPTPTARVEAAVTSVREFAAGRGWPYTFNFYANAGFRDEVWRPVVECANEVSDTSELFLRAHQLGQLMERV